MSKLDDWRKQIDDLDEKILASLAKRISIVRKIGNFKKKSGLDLLDEKRWQEVLKSRLVKAESLNLSTDVIKKLYDLIHKYSLDIEKKS